MFLGYWGIRTAPIRLRSDMNTKSSQVKIGYFTETPFFHKQKPLLPKQLNKLHKGPNLALNPEILSISIQYAYVLYQNDDTFFTKIATK